MVDDDMQLPPWPADNTSPCLGARDLMEPHPVMVGDELCLSLARLWFYLLFDYYLCQTDLTDSREKNNIKNMNTVSIRSTLICLLL